jgi:hypothetical protein
MPGTCPRCSSWRESLGSPAKRTRPQRPTSRRSAVETLTSPLRRCTSWRCGMFRAGTAVLPGHLFEQVIAGGHPEWAAAAMVGLARLQRADPAAEQGLCWRAIETGNRDWSGRAAVALAGMLQRHGDAAGAEAVLRQLAGTATNKWACQAALDLGELLEAAGDLAGAKAAWQPLIGAADAEWAEQAFVRLVNLLRDQGDTDRLRDAYQTGPRDCVHAAVANACGHRPHAPPPR